MDLTTRLIHSFTHKDDALDCPICFNSIHPAQPIWSCSLSSETDTCCWGTFHLKCIRSWAAKSVKETHDAYAARNEEREGEWRCPSCRTMRHVVPAVYMCFCGRAQDPKGSRLITPHSCGEPCIRPRTCEHPCSLPCHPGPCPPCILSVERSCHCGQEIIVSRCSRLHEDPNPTLSCGRICSKPLGCGKHFCMDPCHPGECTPCTQVESVSCYCGKESKSVPCGEGLAKPSAVMIDGQRKEWEGRYECAAVCAQPYACGIHTCESACHPPSLEPETCPKDPSLVLNCPCGKHPIASLPSGLRTSCSDPIPTCGSTCGLSYTTCSHACLSTCHTGPCPPCTVPVNVACRWGQTMRYIACSVRRQQLESGEGEILCDIKCGGMRHCGRHACSRACCPLAALSLSLKKGKAKRRGAVDAQVLEDEDVEGWHNCDLPCNKRLSCGNHYCAEPDHRGPCPPCLQSSFEEFICNCGRTVIEPPVPCGTQMNCPYPCARPDPACGHQKSPHSCHETGECPPCPFLTTKTCACGKSSVTNVRCSQEKVSCGKPCGKLMDCGYHQCDKLCHPGDCGSCAQVCGKARKSCHPLQHGCTSQCHAPSSCPEDEPCKAVVTLRCECGRLQQPASCGATLSNPVSRGHGPFQLKCNQDCAVAKRNRNLAEALGIDAGLGAGGAMGRTSKFAVTWPDDIVSIFRANSAFGMLVEKTLNEFVASDKKTQVLPHMPLQRRDYVRKVAEVYRITARDVDQEPHRSVELTKRIDTRMPDPLLSKAAGPPPAASSLASSSRRLAVLGDAAKRSAASTPTPPAGAASSSLSSSSVWGPGSRSTTPGVAAAAAPRSAAAVVASPGPSAANVAGARKYPNSALAAARASATTTTAALSSSPPTGAGVVNPVAAAIVRDDEDDAPDNWEDDA
ncbi:hypothetical protein DL93DRAFT_2063347 [Clavulina sp. PMI_390]|nr:hypothetical protein DL93DRAFT_2063347 [Clavulina sp. PMI_390]